MRFRIAVVVLLLLLLFTRLPIVFFPCHVTAVIATDELIFTSFDCFVFRASDLLSALVLRRYGSRGEREREGRGFARRRRVAAPSDPIKTVSCRASETSIIRPPRRLRGVLLLFKLTALSRLYRA
jgi:hypothetical protein